ncbi:MAG: penicillin-binding transpeptidase domain-containing protein [Bacteroidota bacterium]
MTPNDPERLNSRWVAGLTAILALFATAVLVKLYAVSLRDGEALRAEGRERVVQQREVPASRGNIYSADGQLLATSMPVYELRWDASIVNQERFDERIQKTVLGLHRLLPERSASEWLTYLREQHREGKRYAFLAKNLSFSLYRKVRDLPLFEGGPFKSGLIAEERYTRLMPMGMLAQRTIGYWRPDAKAGLEATFNEVLGGQNGLRWMQHFGKGQWKPLEAEFEVDPRDGADIEITLDTRIQDIAHRALLQRLEQFQADHGSVIVMEVATGKIRAMVNLGREKDDSVYTELRNYAVWERTEPGSTFKFAALLAALEDGIVDTATKVDTDGGVYVVHGKKVNDSHKGGYGVISLGRALEVSSNTGVVKAIYPKYAADPQEFVDRLYQMGLGEKTGIEVNGESAPFIPNPESARWSGTTLPWMMFGYGVQCTPLQTLAFYNALANDGKMVRPRLWERTLDRGQVVAESELDYIRSSIASKENVMKVRDLMEKVVIRGTAANIKLDSLKLAGKTGTCQLEYWNPANMGYQASFAGYFPADNPKYSCVVVIARPIKSMGYYANIVAAPVFQDIALGITRFIPDDRTPPRGYWSDGLETAARKQEASAEKRWAEAEAALERGSMPNWTGWKATDALHLLERYGYSVQTKGNGRVRSWVPGGGRKSITLILG